ncbi:MAG: PepSY domain-containing protein [Caulobacteraceae bacterium]
MSHAPATDPNMMAIRESIDGASNFAVISPRDYAAKAFPGGLKLGAAAARVLRSARQAVGDAPLSYLELRMIGDMPIGQVLAGKRLLRFDATTGARLPDGVTSSGGGGPPASQHLAVKRWHRLWVLGDWMLWLNALVGIGIGVMVVTGLVMYVELLRARARLDRRGLFWQAGGWWKALHRCLALVAAAFLSVVAVSGVLLSIDSFALQVFKATHPSQLLHGVVPVGMVGDYSTPLADKRLPSLLATTLSAYRAALSPAPIKVVRLRYFSGMPQGVVISGDRDARQSVFNAQTGAAVSSSGPGYPPTGFPFGWQEHELMKQIHRGDIIGLPGRFMDLFAGLSLIFLTTSGLVMYLDLYRRRRKSARNGLIWV